jgi:hypothetical protein
MRENFVSQDTALVAWFRDLMKGPLASNGDYFDRLRASVESSAPTSQPAFEPIYHTCS